MFLQHIKLPIKRVCHQLVTSQKQIHSELQPKNFSTIIHIRLKSICRSGSITRNVYVGFKVADEIPVVIPELNVYLLLSHRQFEVLDKSSVVTIGSI